MDEFKGDPMSIEDEEAFARRTLAEMYRVTSEDKATQAEEQVPSTESLLAPTLIFKRTRLTTRSTRIKRPSPTQTHRRSDLAVAPSVSVLSPRAHDAGSVKRIKKKIYLAGRISKHDWRDGNGRSEFSADEHPCINGVFRETDKTFGNYSFVCTGPNFIGDDHGCGHGHGQHGLGIDSTCIEGCYIDDIKNSEFDRDYTVRACLRSIDRSDVVFAWLESEAYGTVAEIGYAIAMGKEVYVDGPAASDKSDLWFAFRMAARSAYHEHLTPVGSLSALLEDLWNAENPIDSICESPMEKLLFGAFSKIHSFEAIDGRVVSDCGHFKVYPQHETLSYRLDFAIISDSKRIAVEVDGHDFHERTKEQARRDKKRDRDLQAEGWAVLRFTGSEVYADADKCVAEAIAMVRK